jgi:hypothetical protein
MKLRFRKNSLRLRLNQQEVGELAAGISLQEEVRFPGDTSFAYALQTTAGSHPNASFEGGNLHISAPQALVGNWASGEEIGLYFELAASGSPLRIAIEKDLECVDGPPEERDPHAFPRDVKNC